MINTPQTSLGNFVEPALIGARLDATYYIPAAIRAEHKLIDGQQLGLYDVMPLESVSTYIMDFQAFSIYNFVEFSETYKEGWVEFLRVQDLQRGFVDTSKVLWTSPESHNLMKKSQVLPGDILLSIIGTLGIAARWTKKHECNSNQCIAKIRLKPNYDPGYVIAALNSPTMQILIHRDATGTVQKGLSLGGTRRLRLPIPDPKIQAYIGDKVRLAERCREEAGKVYGEGQRLLDSSLDLPAIQEQRFYGWFIEPSRDMLFGRLNAQTYKPYYTMASRYLLERPDCHLLGDLIGNGGKDITGGATPLGASYPNEGIPFLRVQNVQKNYLDLTDVVYIDHSTHSSMKRSQVKPYDIIFTITGYPGSATCVSPDLLPLNMNQHSVRFSIQRDKVDPFFVAAFLNSDYGYIQVKQRATGATRDALDYPSIKTILIPVLDLTLQKKIGHYFRKYAFYRRKSEKLIQEAKSDVESLIDGELDTKAILSGAIYSPRWNNIENELSEHLSNYA